MSTAAQPDRQLIAFIRLGRPHFLAGGIVMNALGVGAALYAGAALDWPALILGQVAVTATQWMVHYANDYYDLPVDRLNPHSTTWSGGSRVLPRGEAPPSLALWAAIALALVAIAAAAALVLLVHSGPLAPLLIGLALLLSWFYSAPPFRFLSSGFGEVETAFIVAVLTPILGFYLQAGYVPAWLFLALWAPFCLQLCFGLCVNFPDAAGDARAGKRTLVVRHPVAATALYMTSLAAAYLALPLMLLAGLPPVVASALLPPAPIAAWLLWRARRGSLVDPERWVANEWGNVVLVFLTAAVEAIAFLLA